MEPKDLSELTDEELLDLAKKNQNSKLYDAIIIGGGIRDGRTAQELCAAGADVLVVGTAFEQDPDLIFAMSEAVHAG